MTKTLLLFTGTIIAIAVIGALLVYTTQMPPSDTTNTDSDKATQSSDPTDDKDFVTKTLTTGLDTPWSLAFLPDNSLLVTERPGRVQRVNKDGSTTTIGTIDDVVESGEGGLLGLAVHPDFETNKYIYLYYTYQATGENTLNRVVRYTLENNTLSERTIITDRIPGALFHNGGRIKFGPDNYLYIATGDAQEPSLSQSRTSLAGKILRVTEDGDPAPGNPFDTRVFSYGHRNPQGLTWDNAGNLWATEHGNSATDELNRIEAGKNYGWPTIRGTEERSGMEIPIIQSGASTWAPGGITFHNNALYFAGLRGNALFRATVDGASASDLTKIFEGEFGRIRDVVVAPDNMLYMTTSNNDGRGNPSSEDDRIIIVNPSKL
jgi:glucose/arabinose dehydrogenase